MSTRKSVVAIRATLEASRLVDVIVPDNVKFVLDPNKSVVHAVLIGDNRDPRTLGGSSGLDTLLPVVQLTVYVPRSPAGDSVGLTLVDSIVALYRAHLFHVYDGVATRVLRSSFRPVFQADTHYCFIVTLYCETIINR